MSDGDEPHGTPAGPSPVATAPTVARPGRAAVEERRRVATARRARRLACVAALAAALLTGAWIVTEPWVAAPAQLALVVGALVAQGVALLAAARGGIDRRVALGAVGLVLTVAVATPVRGSHDLWSYAAAARILVVEHRSPYTHVPAEYPTDPIFGRVAHREIATVYGPVFTGISAALALGTRTSPVATRLSYQLLAAGAALAAALIAERRARHPGALLLVGLGPVTAVIVNQGHNDFLVGLGVLGGAVLVARGRQLLGSLVLALAVLVKLSALAPFAAVTVWVWWKRGFRAAVAVGGTAAALVVGAYLAIGGTSALEPVREVGKHRSRASPWNLTYRPLALGWHSIEHAVENDHRPFVADLPTWAWTAVAILVAIAIVRFARRPRPEEPAAAAGLAWLTASLYVLPWYPGWVTPAASAVWRTRVAALVWAQTAVLALAYVEPPGLPVSRAVRPLWFTFAPWATVAIALALVLWAPGGRPRAPEPAGPAPAEPTTAEPART